MVQEMKTLIAFVLFLFVGWLNNINYLMDSNFDSMSGREVVSAIGVVVAPVGMVNGVIYMFEPEKVE